MSLISVVLLSLDLIAAITFDRFFFENTSNVFIFNGELSSCAPANFPAFYFCASSRSTQWPKSTTGTPGVGKYCLANW